MSAARIRDWTTIDYYALLGVGPGAGTDDIAQAFRTRAKQLHPDANDDPTVHEQFKDISAAYATLSNPRQRREYDRVHFAGVVPLRPPAAPEITVLRKTAGARTTHPRWTRRRSWYAFVGGLVCLVLGVAVSFVTWHLHDADASQRAAFVPVTAERRGDGTIQFTTRDGRRVVTKEPSQHGEGAGTAPTMAVRYDPGRPQHVIVDAGTFGRDITLAIVAIKFLVGGAVFAVLGYRRLFVKRLTSVR